MLTITDFINILTRYYKSPMVTNTHRLLFYLCGDHQTQPAYYFTLTQLNPKTKTNLKLQTHPESFENIYTVYDLCRR